MDYIVVDIRLDQELKEIAIALLGQLGYDGFVESDEGFQCFIVKSEFDEASLQDTLNEIGQGIEYSWKSDQEVNWNQQWEDEFTHFEVSKNTIVRIPSHAPEARFTHEIIISPDMAFGTGHHPTTKMILTHMETMEMASKNVLDVGCGSGVLGIMAGLKGAKSVFGIDIEQRAVENTIENNRLNDTEMEVICGTIQEASFPEYSFDIILANINKNILLNDLPFYSKYLKENGYLVLSGFLKNDVESILSAAFEPQSVVRIYEEDWACLVLEK